MHLKFMLWFEAKSIEAKFFPDFLLSLWSPNEELSLMPNYFRLDIKYLFLLSTLIFPMKSQIHGTEKNGFHYYLFIFRYLVSLLLFS